MISARVRLSAVDIANPDVDGLPEPEVAGKLLRTRPERPLRLGAVDAPQPDALRYAVMQNPDGVAVRDGDDLAGQTSAHRPAATTARRKRPRIIIESSAAVAISFRLIVLVTAVFCTDLPGEH